MEPMAHGPSAPTPTPTLTLAPLPPQDSWLLSLSKPLVGTLFAVLIEGSRIVIVGSIIKSSVGGSEQEKEAIEKAKQSERRRMGKA